jgi:cysteine desulfurase
MKPTYLDYNATTPVDPAVFEAMLPYLREQFGNPSSGHAYGRLAHDAVDKARSQVAALIGASSDEIVFTGSATESINFALKGAIWANANKGATTRTESGHIVTCAIEHPATLRTCEFLQELGCRVTILGVDQHGLVDPQAIRAALDRPTAVVSIMHANNEVGTIQPIREIAGMVHEHGALLHMDAAQSLGKIPVNVTELGADLLSIAGHKLYAPKGVGALYIRKTVTITPLLHGAGQENGRRAGTENVPYLVALGAACAKAQQSLPGVGDRFRLLRERLWQQLRQQLGDDIALNGHPIHRLPNTLNVSFRRRTGAEILSRAGDVAASTGSACHDGSVKVSPVLEAMGVPAEWARGSVRLSVGRFTTEEDVDRAAAALIRASR